MERVREAWLRAIGSLGDAAAMEHGVKCEPIRDQRQVRKYLGHYLVGKRRGETGYHGRPKRRLARRMRRLQRQGRLKELKKIAQKRLPAGVPVAGRWWGASQSLKPIVLAEVVCHDKQEGIRRPAELQVVRCVRRFVQRRLDRRFARGALPDWGGKLAAAVEKMLPSLVQFFGVTPSVQEMLARAGAQWERVEEVEGEAKQERTGLRPCVDFGAGGDYEGAVGEDVGSEEEAGGGQLLLLED